MHSKSNVVGRVVETIYGLETRLQYLTLRDVADYLNIDEKNLRSFIERNELPVFEFPKDQVLIASGHIPGLKQLLALEPTIKRGL